MQQQINLYQPVADTRQEPFTALMMLAILIFTVVLMMVFYGVLHWKKAQLEQEVATLKVQNEKTQQTVEKLEGMVRQLTDSKQEQQKLNYLKRVYASKQNALEELSTMIKGNSEGVSEYFSALARKNIEPLWFNDINVYDGGQQIYLKGQTTDARSIPEFVTSLNAEKAYQGVDFKLFSAKRDEQGKVLQFIMQTETKMTDAKTSKP